MWRAASVLVSRLRYSSSTAVAATAAAVSQQREKLVILGSGWGAASLLKGIDAAKFDVTVVSPRNHFLMTALLPGVTVGTVEGRSIVEPIRLLLPGKQHPEDSRYYEASAVDVDPRAKTITCRQGVSYESCLRPLRVSRVLITAIIKSHFGICDAQVARHSLPL